MKGFNIKPHLDRCVDAIDAVDAGEGDAGEAADMLEALSYQIEGDLASLACFAAEALRLLADGEVESGQIDFTAMQIQLKRAWRVQLSEDRLGVGMPGAATDSIKYAVGLGGV